MAIIWTQEGGAITEVAGCSGNAAGATTDGRDATVGGTGDTTNRAIDPDNGTAAPFRRTMHWLGDAQADQDWGSGTHVIRLNVVTARSGVEWEETIICESLTPFSGGGFNTVQNFTGLNIACDTTGVKSHSPAQSSPFVVAGDLSRPYWVLSMSGPQHGQSSIEIDSDQDLDTPWNIVIDNLREPMISDRFYNPLLRM